MSDESEREMAKFKVLLHGRDVFLRDESGTPQSAGFYVTCCVEAPDETAAGEMALLELKAHPKYQALAAWPGGDGDRPPVAVDSVDRVPWWRRRPAPGITTGFIFFVDAEQQPSSGAEKRA